LGATQRVLPLPPSMPPARRHPPLLLHLVVVWMEL
jgi:hypothetical protein